MPVYGQRPDDVVTDTAGNVQSGVTLTLHATEADAIAGTNVLASPTVTAGRWTANVTAAPVWVRSSGGAYYKIEDFGSKLDVTTANATYGRQSTPLPAPVTDPAGWSWAGHPLTGKLFVDQQGIFTTTLDPTTYKVTGGVTYYVDLVAGNDTNDGLSDATALQRLYTALGKADVGTVMLKGYANNATPYYRGRGTNGLVYSKSVNIIGYGAGMPAVTTHDLLTWTLTAGKTSTYQSARSGVVRVVDAIDGSSGVELLKVGSIDAVEATPGSWFTDNVTVYVRPSTARAADAYIWALLSTVNVEFSGDWRLYIEGVKFYGGSECVRSNGATATGSLLVMNDCEVYCSTSGTNNVAVNDGDAIMVYVKSSRAGSDGFGYHKAGAGHAPRVVEIGCRSTDCGSSSDDQNSTIHDGGKIIRVNGTYLRAVGANLADVNDTTESWNLGCVLEDSVNGWNFKAGNDAGTVKMWLDGCTTRGARWSVYAYGTAQVKARASRLDRRLGTVAAY